MPRVELEPALEEPSYEELVQKRLKAEARRAQILAVARAAGIVAFVTLLAVGLLYYAQWKTGFQGSRFVYSFVFECDPANDNQIIELLTVRNTGNVCAEGFHIEIHNTGEQILEAQSEWPNQEIEPEIPLEVSNTKIRVPPFPLDANATYTLRMVLANYVSTDVAKVRDIVSAQEGSMTIAAQNALPGQPQRERLEVGFPELQTYTVQDSDTLEDIASRFGVSIDELLVINPSLDPLSDRRVVPGQNLVIQRAECGPPTIASTRPFGGWTTVGYHVVRPGEDLYCIGRGYGVDPWSIATHNGILNPRSTYPGQVLAIPNAYAWIGPGPTCPPQYSSPYPYPCTCAAYHTVASGERLYDISLNYGVSIWKIADCNGILNLNYFRAGDVLCIPAAE
jgi:LysM repeat protein